MKLCKDCRFNVKDSSPEFRDDEYFQLKWSKCGRKQIPVNPVTGEPPQPKSFCAQERKSPLLLAILLSECGKSGRYFEPKQ